MSAGPGSGAPRATIIDCDPGTDDALALWLALASPELDLRLVTVAGGNVGLERTLANARAVVALSGRPIPVVPGADRPLRGALRRRAGGARRRTGWRGVTLPQGPPAVRAVAADAIRAVLREAAPGSATLVGIGPATNLALALATEPELAGRVREIVMMGGAWGEGNWTPAAEFNAASDPEALDMLLALGAPLTLVTLELTVQALVTPGPGRGPSAAAAAAPACGRPATSWRPCRPPAGWAARATRCTTLRRGLAARARPCSGPGRRRWRSIAAPAPAAGGPMWTAGAAGARTARHPAGAARRRGLLRAPRPAPRAPALSPAPPGTPATPVLAGGATTRGARALPRSSPTGAAPSSGRRTASAPSAAPWRRAWTRSSATSTSRPTASRWSCTTPTLDRTSNGRGPVAERSAAELAALRLIGAGGEGVPRLADLLALVAGGRGGIQIEVKADHQGRADRALLRKVLDALDGAGLRARAEIIVFEAEVAAAAVAAGGLRNVAWLFGPPMLRHIGLEGVLAVAQRAGVGMVETHEAAMDAALLGALRGAGLRVGAWGANHAPAIGRMLDLGLDAVATDDPVLALSLRAR